jgi:hypothetical protein
VRVLSVDAFLKWSYEEQGNCATLHAQP